MALKLGQINAEGGLIQPARGERDEVKAIARNLLESFSRCLAVPTTGKVMAKVTKLGIVSLARVQLAPVGWDR
jgi:hypothetical protein